MKTLGLFISCVVTGVILSLSVIENCPAQEPPDGKENSRRVGQVPISSGGVPQIPGWRSGGAFTGRADVPSALAKKPVDPFAVANSWRSSLSSGSRLEVLNALKACENKADLLVPVAPWEPWLGAHGRSRPPRAVRRMFINGEELNLPPVEVSERQREREEYFLFLLKLFDDLDGYSQNNHSFIASLLQNGVRPELETPALEIYLRKGGNIFLPLERPGITAPRTRRYNISSLLGHRSPRLPPDRRLWLGVFSGLDDDKDLEFTVHYSVLERFHDNPRLLEILIDNIDEEAADHFGRNALHYAVEAGNSAAVRKLLQRGFDPSRCDSTGMNCIDIARYHENLPMLQLLNEFTEQSGSLWAGPDDDARLLAVHDYATGINPPQDLTVLATTAWRMGYPRVALELLQSGRQPGRTDVYGQSLPGAACAAMDITFIRQYLSRFGCDQSLIYSLIGLPWQHYNDVSFPENYESFLQGLLMDEAVSMSNEERSGLLQCLLPVSVAAGWTSILDLALANGADPLRNFVVHGFPIGSAYSIWMERSRELWGQGKEVPDLVHAADAITLSLNSGTPSGWASLDPDGLYSLLYDVTRPVIQRHRELKNYGVTLLDPSTRVYGDYVIDLLYTGQYGTLQSMLESGMPWPVKFFNPSGETVPFSFAIVENLGEHYHPVRQWKLNESVINNRSRHLVTALQFYHDNGGRLDELNDKGQNLLFHAGYVLPQYSSVGNSFKLLEDSRRVIRFLVSQGININGQDQLGLTPLHFHSIHNDSITAMALIETGAEVGVPDMFGLTPAHMAMIPPPDFHTTGVLHLDQKVSLISSLFEAAPDLVNKPDRDGYTPLHYLMMMVTEDYPAYEYDKFYIPVFKVLENLKCDWTVKSRLGQTPVDIYTGFIRTGVVGGWDVTLDNLIASSDKTYKPQQRIGPDDHDFNNVEARRRERKEEILGTDPGPFGQYPPHYTNSIEGSCAPFWKLRNMIATAPDATEKPETRRVLNDRELQQLRIIQLRDDLLSAGEDNIEAIMKELMDPAVMNILFPDSPYWPDGHLLHGIREQYALDPLEYALSGNKLSLARRFLELGWDPTLIALPSQRCPAELIHEMNDPELWQALQSRIEKLPFNRKAMAWTVDQLRGFLDRLAADPAEAPGMLEIAGAMVNVTLLDNVEKLSVLLDYAMSLPLFNDSDYLKSVIATLIYSAEISFSPSCLEEISRRFARLNLNGYLRPDFYLGRIGTVDDRIAYLQTIQSPFSQPRLGLPVSLMTWRRFPVGSLRQVAQDALRDGRNPPSRLPAAFGSQKIEEHHHASQESLREFLGLQ